ncbi:DUF1292 domain-containing protein [Fusibacter sp. JL298sf-3]
MSEHHKDGHCCGDHSCGCDHDHEHHVHTVTLELENGDTLECPIINIFEVESSEYIALLHPEEEIAMLYEFKDYDDGSIELSEIVSDETYEKVSEAFNAQFEEEEE